MNNFYIWFQSVSLDIYMYIDNLFFSTSFLSFVVGFILASLIIGFVVTKNPRHIPILLQLSIEEAYQHISSHYSTSKLGSLGYREFIKIYLSIRILFSLIFIVFFATIFIIVLKQGF